MKEYLIKREDTEFCIVSANRYSDVLHPYSLHAEKTDGWGDYGLCMENCQISFSMEPVGIHIVFEKGTISNERADKIIEEICRQVEYEIKSDCYWIQIAGW